ncbi:MAG: AmmeMemoRadiSam system protein B [Candidatus Aminicenantes bacterium]|nr:AmmeMemoRadiSam system protein B [Candidatus Aminicenantes bacterium]
MIRQPAVAGYFYPGRAEELRKMISGLIPKESEKKKAFGIVSPHAGYVYSGQVAAAVFASVDIPPIAVILGPSHRGINSLFALQGSGVWRTPLGEVKIYAELASRLMAISSLFEDEPRAHAFEHSLEVQVPFLQYFRPDIMIVPICVSPEADFSSLEEAGLALAQAVKEEKQETFLVASTDMSHYLSQKEAEKKDFLAIKKIENLDARGLYDIVLRENISMCGFQPTCSVLIACKQLGASRGELILYQTSGDVTGDYREVVGYAGCRLL